MRALVLAVVLIVTVAPTAQAIERSGADVSALAARAADGDTAALDALRETTAVDGQPADLAVVLEADAAADLEQRLRLLAANTGADAAPAADATGTAREVLAGEQYGQTQSRGVFDWIGDQLRWVGRRIEQLVDELDDLLPGGVAVPWAVLGGLVLLLAAVATVASSRGLEVAGARGGRAGGVGDIAADAAALDAAALAAERDGDLNLALRLRFAAGLRRLGDREVIALRPSLTVNDVRRRVRSPSFDVVAATFEDVAYGEKAATAADVGEARETWPRVLEETRA